MRRTAWRVVQGLLGAVVLVFLGLDFLKNWHKVRDKTIVWDFHWEFIAAALIVTWAMYGVLIWGWRVVLHGWGQRIRIVDAARIWTVSSLGKYIPGKVWSIAGMAMMAKQKGVSGTMATGSAIVMQLVSIATGMMLAVALTGTDLLSRNWGGNIAVAAVALAVIPLIAAAALTSPSVTRRLGFILRRSDALPPVDPSALAGALFANLIAWAGYGVSLQLFALGTLRDVHLSWAVATGAFAASYIAGYLALLVPGGFGVRELFMIKLLMASGLDIESATAISFGSRIALTINELGAAVPFLLSRSRLRELNSPA